MVLDKFITGIRLYDLILFQHVNAQDGVLMYTRSSHELSILTNLSHYIFVSAGTSYDFVLGTSRVGYDLAWYELIMIASASRLAIFCRIA